MLSDQKVRTGLGELQGPSDNTAVFIIVGFVEKYLVDFAKRYSGIDIKNEKGLTQKLCIMLNQNAIIIGYPFFFYPDYMENSQNGNSPQVDMGTISIDETVIIDSKTYKDSKSFFSFEAKRLCRISAAREKEYLIGHAKKGGGYVDSGGVERFKKEIHGKGLNYSAIIGYVQEQDFSYWYNLINSWIDQLIAGDLYSSVKWENKDKLVNENLGNDTAKYKSENSRQQGYVTLFHLWVNMVKNNN